MDLGDMNIALIVKWIFNYANNKDALWRKVACARSKGNSNRLMLVLGNGGDKLVLLKFVKSVLGRSSQARKAIN